MLLEIFIPEQKSLGCEIKESTYVILTVSSFIEKGNSHKWELNPPSNSFVDELIVINSLTLVKYVGSVKPLLKVIGKKIDKDTREIVTSSVTIHVENVNAIKDFPGPPIWR